MTPPISTTVLISEMESSAAILAAWIERTKAGLPGVDVPGSEENLEDFLRNMCGELLLVSRKTEGLANIVLGNT